MNRAPTMSKGEFIAGNAVDGGGPRGAPMPWLERKKKEKDNAETQRARRLRRERRKYYEVGAAVAHDRKERKSRFLATLGMTMQCGLHVGFRRLRANVKVKE